MHASLRSLGWLNWIAGYVLSVLWFTDMVTLKEQLWTVSCQSKMGGPSHRKSCILGCPSLLERCRCYSYDGFSKSQVASTFFLNIPSLSIPIKDSASDNYHISFESRVSDVCGVGQHWYHQHLKTYVRLFLPLVFREIMKIGLSQKILTHSLKYMHSIFELPSFFGLLGL